MMFSSSRAYLKGNSEFLNKNLDSFFAHEIFFMEHPHRKIEKNYQSFTKHLKIN